MADLCGQYEQHVECTSPGGSDKVSPFTSALLMVIIFNALLKSHVQTSSQARDLIAIAKLPYNCLTDLWSETVYFPTVLIQKVKNDTVALF